MVKRFLILLVLIFFVIMLMPLVSDIQPQTELNPLAEKYVKDGPDELGSANLVTSVIVTYRGLDTLGEVAVLFIATAGVGFMLRRRKDSKLNPQKKRESSEILQTGTALLTPLIFLFGIYIFLHGHLTPGGGFQGGVVIASAVLLSLLSYPQAEVNHKILNAIKSLSGAFYILIGVLGLYLAAGFLDNRILPLGDFGHLFSAGAIPVIYSLIGLKVGSELVGILDSMQRSDS
ncbi:MAG: Na(+)/H(+) antiporter subunit B [Candidatus Marinimicrobia bacterium]|nr:Na(+)/H(+) antiporter subunit B [Candidatus Neomarinimicrobiota bacterium]